AHPSVGRHLRIHPVSIVGALHDEPVDMWRGTMQAARSLEFASDEPGRRRYVIESAPGHLGLLALVLPWEGATAHAELMARARHFGVRSPRRTRWARSASAPTQPTIPRTLAAGSVPTLAEASFPASTSRTPRRSRRVSGSTR